MWSQYRAIRQILQSLYCRSLFSFRLQQAHLILLRTMVNTISLPLHGGSGSLKHSSTSAKNNVCSPRRMPKSRLIAVATFQRIRGSSTSSEAKLQSSPLKPTMRTVVEASFNAILNESEPPPFEPKWYYQPSSCCNDLGQIGVHRCFDT